MTREELSGLSFQGSPSESDFRAVRIPSHLYRKIAERLAGSEFGSVEEWVVKLIESEIGSPPALSEQEEANIRDRLKKIGYE